VWNQLNGLEPVFGMGYYEDFDFSLRLREAGYNQAISEDVFVYHQGSATFGQSSNLKKLIKKNKELIIRRHQSVRFLHVRACNLLVLQSSAYVSESKADYAIKRRRQIRVDSLRKDVPKGLFKKILWNFSINRKKIAGDGRFRFALF
jgi:GT2 family glycosyltransferase